MMNLQRIQRDLKKLNDISHTITEGSGDRRSGRRAKMEIEAEAEEEARETEKRRRRAGFRKGISSILELVSPEKIEEYFRTGNHETIWEA
jgi:hypothetical protein